MAADLLGPTPDKPEKKRKTVKAVLVPNAPSPVAGPMTLYLDLFFAKAGFYPLQKGRIGKFLKELVDAWGVEATEDVVRKFFNSKDPRIFGSDYSIGVFQFHAQRLRMGQRTVDPRTAANAHEVAKATGRDR